ncbi:unnamed protein product, partial [Angiostrongylus costaricensis]|uniref:BPTI/Kunitz inhibitor domain-containing protein n=1 Tax=Angiostrongylus costaricensis TaxID=334426 RepID=A0A158PMB0_ANGCS
HIHFNGDGVLVFFFLSLAVVSAVIYPLFFPECELSEWSGWSRCYGTCYYALSVRNRDVIRPSIPENSLDRVKRCTKLYETRFCSLRTCEVTTRDFVVTSDLPKRLKPAQERLPMDGKGKWKISEDIGELEASEAAIHDAIRKRTVTTTPYFVKKATAIATTKVEEEPIVTMSVNKKDSSISEEVSTLTSYSNFTAESLPSSDLNDTSTNASSTNNTQNSRITLGSELFAKTQSDGVDGKNTASYDHSTNRIIILTILNNFYQKSSFFLFQGYVPNTRKHASEITSKLYMTQEIIQDKPKPVPLLRHVECLESRRCCKITRTQCSDGTTPKYVKRYYRPRAAETCLPYYYPRCSSIEEMDEQPIQYEQNCQDICFKGSEKRISPLFQIAFEN